MAIPNRHAWICGLLALISIGAVPGLVEAEPQVIKAAVCISSEKEPALYLQFRNNKLWMATTKKEVEKVTPLRAATVEQNKDADQNFQSRSYNFPEVSLPVSQRGVEKIQATFYSHSVMSAGSKVDQRQLDQVYVAAMFRLTRRDGSGKTWTYTCQASADTTSDKVATQRLDLIMPKFDVDALTMGIETKVEGRDASIGLRVNCGDVTIDGIQKGEANTPVTLEIVDLEGKTIVSEKGDLEKFGFT